MESTAIRRGSRVGADVFVSSSLSWRLVVVSPSLSYRRSASRDGAVPVGGDVAKRPSEAKECIRTETTMKTRRGLHDDDDDDSEGDENENGGDGKFFLHFFTT